FYVISGETPVLISAPHVHAHFRPNLDKRYKTGEPWADVILQSVARETNSFGIYSVNDLEYDPNYDDLSKNEYKAEAAALIRRMKIKYFFDLHGLNDMHQYDFGVFYVQRYGRSHNLAYDFAAAMDERQL